MTSSPQSGKRILIIEDNVITREGLAVVLQREGYTVAGVGNGQEALGFLRNSPAPNLVPLDMMLPVLDGWSFLAHYKQNTALTAIPVLILTALSVASPEWALSLGAVGVLRKPIDVEPLLKAIQRYC